MTEIVIRVEDLERFSKISVCRICHEEEFEGFGISRLEAPCACSGTVKFAHRDCVQRWCDEKGNTTCEICLQKFEPGYTYPPPKPSSSIEPTITVARRTNLESGINEDEYPRVCEEVQNSACASENHANASSHCRNLTFVITFLLLTVNAFILVRGEKGYPLPICVVFIAKAIGIIVPMYIFAKVASIIDQHINNYYQLRSYYDPMRSSVEEDQVQVGEPQHINILIRP